MVAGGVWSAGLLKPDNDIITPMVIISLLLTGILLTLVVIAWRQIAGKERFAQHWQKIAGTAHDVAAMARSEEEGFAQHWRKIASTAHDIAAMARSEVDFRARLKSAGKYALYLSFVLFIYGVVVLRLEQGRTDWAEIILGTLMIAFIGFLAASGGIWILLILFDSVKLFRNPEK